MGVLIGMVAHQSEPHPGDGLPELLYSVSSKHLFYEPGVLYFCYTGLFLYDTWTNINF